MKRVRGTGTEAEGDLGEKVSTAPQFPPPFWRGWPQGSV